VVLVLLLIAVAALFSAQPAAAQANEAKVRAVIRPTPSIAVMPGGELVYTLHVRNEGMTDASAVRVNVYYDPTYLSLLGTTFTTDKDWVSSLVSDNPEYEQVTITFSGLNEGESRTADILMQVRETMPNGAPVPHGTVIQTWARYYWFDPTGQRDYRASNAAPVLVAPYTQHSEFVWMMVDPPAAPAGSTFRFMSDRFLPNEGMVFWLNTSGGGTAPVNQETRVDESGRFTLEYTAEGLAPGTYHMIAFGKNSELTAAVPFTVEPPATP
jgi:hypothetical protein